MNLRGQATTAAAPAGAAEAAGHQHGRPWWIWAAPFALLLSVLLVRNRFLFTQKFYEQGDAGANSIKIEQAMHFTLLVGNYSREHFSHPGPAYLYAQAFGQWLFLYLLHIVPAAWNAHLLAVFVLNCALAGLAVLIVYGWTRSVRGAAACFAVVTALAAVQPPAINSDWMPYLYVPMFAVFCLAAASVAAGAARDAWILALTGWFLIHGHACFLFIVPVIVAAVVAVLLLVHRRAPRAALRHLAQRRGVWVPVLAISALFALPIVVNLVLHWPGEFGKYLSYGRSGKASGHTAIQIARYALWFWWPHPHRWLAPLLLFAAAFAVTFGLIRGPLRRFLAMVLFIDLVASAAVGVYAVTGIDALNAYYIAYFYWSAPLLVLLVIAVGIAQALGTGTGTVLAAAGAAATLIAFAVVPGTRTSTQDTDARLPGAVAAMAARSGGREIVLSLNIHSAWVDTTGLLVQAERSHLRACVDGPYWSFMMTSQFICTSRQVAQGAHYGLNPPSSRGPVIARLPNSVVQAQPAR
jgi:hypothetical protein